MKFESVEVKTAVRLRFPEFANCTEQFEATPFVTLTVQIAVPGVGDKGSKIEIDPDFGTAVPLGAPKKAGVTEVLNTTDVFTLELVGDADVIAAIVLTALIVWVAVPTVPTVKLRSVL